MKITEILPCSSDLSPSQQSSSSGDLRPEMMESETPPSAAPSGRTDDPEVSSRRVSPSPAGPESSAPIGVRPVELKDLLGRVSISEDHRTLMSTVIERISSAESGLHEAFMSLLTGFEVREMMYIFDSTAHF